MVDPVPKKRSVEIITPEHETLLWKLGILNLTDSIGLSRATYFYFCKAFGVYSRNAIRDVIREQFRFGEDEYGKFIEFVDFEKHEGYASSAVAETSAVPTRRVIQYDDPANDLSVYKIMTRYMAHIPASGEFFRRPINASVDCPNPIQFSNRPIGINHLSHYLSDMMKSAGLWKEHFTTQSIKSAVVSVLFRVGINEDISRQRTRWWGLGRAVSSNSSGLKPARKGVSVTEMQSDRQKLVAISRLLDPPPFTPLRPATKVSVRPSVLDVQQMKAPECQSYSDEGSPNAPSTSHIDIPLHARASPPSIAQETRSSYLQKESQGEMQRWYPGASSYSSDSGADEDQFQPKRLCYASPPKSPDGQSGTHQDFVAMSGPFIDTTTVPKQISRFPIIKIERDEDVDEDVECCVVASSIGDHRAQTSHDCQTSRATSTKRKATSSISSSRQGAYFVDSSRTGLKNRMQCLTNAEMKEASSRPPEEGTSALSLAFKFAYEIDHNGEVAASREVRALHTTASNESTILVKRRLLPLNVVDLSGKEATERQEELPNFSIKLSDFFPSISQQKLDIKDVVIRGTRGQGTDRLNIEVAVAETSENEQDVQLVDQYEYQ